MGVWDYGGGVEGVWDGGGMRVSKGRLFLEVYGILVSLLDFCFCLG